MSYAVQITRQRRPSVQATVLARRIAIAVRDWWSESLIGGWSPVDGSDRPRKADQKPLGYDTGLLARGMFVRPGEKTPALATFEIALPASRRMLADAKLELGGMSFIERYQIMSLEGRTQEVIDEATEAYFAELRSRSS